MIGTFVVVDLLVVVAVVVLAVWCPCPGRCPVLIDVATIVAVVVAISDAKATASSSRRAALPDDTLNHLTRVYELAFTSLRFKLRSPTRPGSLDGIAWITLSSHLTTCANTASWTATPIPVLLPALGTSWPGARARETAKHVLADRSWRCALAAM